MAVASNALGLDGRYDIDFVDEGDMLKRVFRSVEDGDELFSFTAGSEDPNLEFDFLGARASETLELRWLFVVDARQTVSSEC